MDQDKLGKIVALAKHGIGGEKESALRLVKRICKKHDLDFEEVMNASEDIREYVYYYKTKTELKIVGQIIFKILDSQEIGQNKFRKALFFNCTPQQSVEIFSAIPIYLRAFQAEKKRIIEQLPSAFVIKHELWSTHRPEREGELSLKDIEEIAQKHKLSTNLVEDVIVRKQLEK